MGTYQFLLTARGKYGRYVTSAVTVTINATSDTDWTQTGGNGGHTGLATSVPALSSGNVGKIHRLWSVATSSVSWSSPVVAGGTAYIEAPDTADDSSQLEAFSAATGALLWSVPMNGGADTCAASGQEAMTCAPAETEGVVIVDAVVPNSDPTAAEQWIVEGYDAGSGDLLWTYQAQNGFPCVATDGGTVYIGQDGEVVALSAVSGAVQWTTQLADLPMAAPAIADGHVYVITESLGGAQTLNILDSSTGAAQKAVMVPSTTSFAPPVVDHGRVLLTIEPPVDADGNGTGGPAHLLALNDTTGATLWSSKLGWATDPWTVGRPVAAGSLILVGDPYGDLAAIDVATGQQAWLRKDLSGTPDTQLDAVSGNVLVTSGDFGSADLVNIDNGSVLRQVSHSAPGQNAVNESAIDAGVIYVTSESSVTAYGP